MTKAQTLYKLAHEQALKTVDFFTIKGPGEGNIATNIFVSELQIKANKVFNEDFSEKKICGENSLPVDYYFPDENTIIEIAFGLKKPNSEFEKDILKAIMAKKFDEKISKLIFITKPGGEKKCNQPGRKAIRNWVKESHNIEVEVFDLINKV